MNCFNHLEQIIIDHSEEKQEDFCLYDDPFQQQKIKHTTTNSDLSNQMNLLQIKRERKTKKKISKVQKQRNNLQKKKKEIANQKETDAQYMEAHSNSYEIENFNQSLIQLFSTQESNQLPQNTN